MVRHETLIANATTGETTRRAMTAAEIRQVETDAAVLQPKFEAGEARAQARIDRIPRLQALAAKGSTLTAAEVAAAVKDLLVDYQA